MAKDGIPINQVSSVVGASVIDIQRWERVAEAIHVGRGVRRVLGAVEETMVAAELG